MNKAEEVFKVETPIELIARTSKNCHDMIELIDKIKVSCPSILIQFADPINKIFSVVYNAAQPRQSAKQIQDELNQIGLCPTDWMALASHPGSYNWELHASGYIFRMNFVQDNPIPVQL